MTRRIVDAMKRDRRQPADRRLKGRSNPTVVSQIQRVDRVHQRREVLIGDRDADTCIRVPLAIAVPTTPAPTRQTDGEFMTFRAIL